MRTTLTIEDQLLDDLKQRVRASGQPFRQVVEQALRAGLSALDRPQPARCRLEPHSLGKPRAAFDLVKARALADALEDEAIAEKSDQSR